MNLYVASSWRNPDFDKVVGGIKASFPDMDVYDFKHDKGAQFHWSEVGVDPQSLITVDDFNRALVQSRTIEAANSDYTALERADALILVLECNKSAHLELGYALGQGKPCAVLAPSGEFTPELMYFPAQLITQYMGSLLDWLESLL